MATFDLFSNKNLLNNEHFHRNNPNESILKICLKYGVLTSLLLVMTFVTFCVYTYRLQIHQLSVVNMFVIAFGIYFALVNYSPNGKAGSVDYFEGFKVGLYTSLVSVAMHALFLLIYCYFDSSVLPTITSGDFYGVGFHPFSVAGVTLFEGLASGLIITFCIMQYFKKNEY